MKEKFIVRYLSSNGVDVALEHMVPDGWVVVDYQAVATGGKGLGCYFIVRLREVIGAST
jgi:hypothetical protein